MSRLRVALISRRFWPLVGGVEGLMANLADSLHQLESQVTVLTARWDKKWPAHFVHREIPVYRLANPRQRGWGTFRYMRAIQQWLIQHRRELDVVLVSMLRHDAYAAVKVAQRTGLPVVLRCEGGGPTGDRQWQSESRYGLRIREATQHASAWIAPDRPTADQLIDSGYDAERIHVIANGVAIPAPRTLQRQGHARLALADAHNILSMPPREPLVVFAGRLRVGKGLTTLIQAWREVQQKWPRAKLWIIGEGPQGPALWEQIKKAELTGSVVMPGSFDSLTEIWHAADLFVSPSQENHSSLALREAMAAGLPVIASQIPAHQRVVSHRQTGLVFPPGDSQQLFSAIAEILEQQEQAENYAQQARQLMQEQFSLDNMARAHRELLQQVASS